VAHTGTHGDTTPHYNKNVVGPVVDGRRAAQPIWHKIGPPKLTPEESPPPGMYLWDILPVSLYLAISHHVAAAPAAAALSLTA